MRRAFGFVVVLYSLSIFFEAAFSAFDSAARESFKTLELAAVVTQEKLLQQ